MRSSVVPLLQCPSCRSDVPLELDPPGDDGPSEIRSARLQCRAAPEHRFEVEDGILMFGSGLDHETVRREVSYEDGTYEGDPRLHDPRFVASLPESGAEMWPHTRHFGTDFRQLVETMGVRPGDWILDVGTAACWTSRLLAERGAHVVALDVNPADFYGLRASDLQFEAHGVFFERVLASMADLPFRTGSFHKIVFNASFHHTPDMQRTLSECRRVLRSNGVVAMVNEELTSLRHRLRGPEEHHEEEGAHHDIAYREMEKAARQLGFRLEYRLARHVRERLERRLSPPLASFVTWCFERNPALIKQLDSALIVLRPSTKDQAPAVHRINTVSPRV